MYNSSIRTRRAGISIIEVLTSIVVAMIGVFGVMVLIPFAVKQAQTGLTRDAATVVGHNAHAQFEIEGFKRLALETGLGTPIDPFEFRARWSFHVNPQVIPAVVNKSHFFDHTRQYNQYTFDSAGPFAPTNAANPFQNGVGPVLIDPLYLAAHDDEPAATATIYDGTTGFYYPLRVQDSLVGPAEVIPFRRANLVHITSSILTPQGIVANNFDQAMARRLCRATDDLEFGDPVSELTGPNQVFDVAEVDGTNPGPELVRRQFRGQLSWNALLVPVKDDYANPPPAFGADVGTDSWKFQMFVMVHKDREIYDRNIANPIERNIVVATRVDHTLPAPLTTGVGRNGGTVYLESAMGDVRQDHWVMLVNRPTPPLAANVEVGFETQVGFFRVISYDEGGVGFQPSLTLDGPDFNFDNGQTLVVHLKNVVNVYERTIRWEQKSNWN